MEEVLRELVNPGVVGKIVVFDTWVSNCDRHPPDLTVRRPNYDNVFLEHSPGTGEHKLRLVAMDHSYCFTCGRDLDERVAHIQRVKNEMACRERPAGKNSHGQCEGYPMWNANWSNETAKVEGEETGGPIRSLLKAVLFRHRLADGSNFLIRTGDEYRDIFAVYDWRKIPGTTVLQKPEMPPPREIQQRGLSSR